MHQTGDWHERKISNKSSNLPQVTLHTSKAQVKHILMYLLISSTSHCIGKAACEHFSHHISIHSFVQITAVLWRRSCKRLQRFCNGEPKHCRPSYVPGNVLEPKGKRPLHIFPHQQGKRNKMELHEILLKPGTRKCLCFHLSESFTNWQNQQL